jgi:hypothetical protein
LNLKYYEAEGEDGIRLEVLSTCTKYFITSGRLARAAAQESKGLAIIQQCGYSGEFRGEWREYAV